MSLPLPPSRLESLADPATRLEDRIEGRPIDDEKRGVLEVDFTVKVDGTSGKASTRAIVFYPEEWRGPPEGLPLLLLGHVSAPSG